MDKTKQRGQAVFADIQSSLSVGLFAPGSEACSLPPAVPPEVGLSCGIVAAFCFLDFASLPLPARDRFLPEVAVPLVCPAASAGSIVVTDVPLEGGGNAPGATAA